ncbi:RNA polymerase II holoenzyme cyclin-like subunit [Abortiporus biennis]
MCEAACVYSQSSQPSTTSEGKKHQLLTGSHYKRWIVDRNTIKQSRAEDLLYVEDPLYLDLLAIYFANLISKLGKKLQLRQRVIATAIVFFRRFYLKNSYCETDPFMVIAACCYVAAKAEESPVHIKNVVTEARYLFGNEEYGYKSFPSDNSKLAEMEFYLVDDLECDLVVFHPYRTLLALCGKESATEIEPGETVRGGQDDSPYWTSGGGKLELQEEALQMAWFIVNDTYRSDLCLIYPPQLIAIAAIQLTLVFHAPTRATLHLHSSSPSSQVSNGNSSNNNHSQPSANSHHPTRRSSRSSTSNGKKAHPPQDPISFMAGLNVNIATVATIVQEIISLYTLWERYRDDSVDATATLSLSTFPSMHAGSSKSGQGGRRSGSVFSGGTTTSSAGTPIGGDVTSPSQNPTQVRPVPAVVTPSWLSQVLHRMREAKLADVTHSALGGRPVVALNKRLERAQAAG